MPVCSSCQSNNWSKVRPGSSGEPNSIDATSAAIDETASMTAAAEASFALSTDWGLLGGVLGLAEPGARSLGLATLAGLPATSN